MKWFRVFSLCFVLGFLASCAGMAPEEAALRIKPAQFDHLPGWGQDDPSDALAALENSCARILKKDPGLPVSTDIDAGLYGDWQAVCEEMKLVPKNDPAAVRAFFEDRFQPYAAYGGFSRTGLFTGYYEPELNGARARTGRYAVPLYVRPQDLVMVDLGLFRDHLKGERIAGRVKNGRLYPYEDRASIEDGALAGKGLELVWVDDPIGAFFLHIQGSGRIRFEDGSVMRVGYAGQNGHSYYAIGRELIKRGVLTRDTVSLEAIRGWLQTHPDEAAELMNLNPSYVFFQELKTQQPLGGEGVPLTPGRSLAVDSSKVPYGIPVYLMADAPTDDGEKLQRLMVAQDTGGAIRGAVRGDVFFGYGDEAEYAAGHMKSKGRYWLLLPKDRAASAQLAAGF